MSRSTDDAEALTLGAQVHPKTHAVGADVCSLAAAVDSASSS